MRCHLRLWLREENHPVLAPGTPPASRLPPVFHGRLDSSQAGGLRRAAQSGYGGAPAPGPQSCTPSSPGGSGPAILRLQSKDVCKLLLLSRVGPPGPGGVGTLSPRCALGGPTGVLVVVPGLLSPHVSRGPGVGRRVPSCLSHQEQRLRERPREGRREQAPFRSRRVGGQLQICPGLQGDPTCPAGGWHLCPR